MDLRPHHLFCARFYRGHGYSAAFCENMKRVLSRLKAGEDLTLVTGGDALCAACPHFLSENGAGLCDQEEKVRRFDENALRFLRLSPGQSLSFPQALERENEYVFACGRFSEVCPDCEWRLLCESILKTEDSYKPEDEKHEGV